jgi:hypothetical protein
MRMKTAGGIAVALVLCAILAVFVFRSFTRVGGSSSFEETLAQAAAQANKSLPMMIDKETRLDATAAEEGKRFIYTYTLVNYERGHVDTSMLRRSIRPTLVENYKTNEQMKGFREEHVELHYRYYDKNGEPLMEIVVSPSDF